MTTRSATEPLLDVAGIDVAFDGAHGTVHAVRDVSLQVHRGEVLAIVGESGSGKSTLARSIMGMVPARSGVLTLEGGTLARSVRQRTLAQRRSIGMVFQDSGAAFDPRFTVQRILEEPLRSLAQAGLSGAGTTPARLLDDVGLSRSMLERRPHELSGGQRQRVGIARALATAPELLICDEAVSALDVSVQAQILNLLAHLQAERQLSFLFITHDISVVEYFADRIAVMYQGRLLETGDAAEVLDHPQQAYTRRLLESVRPAFTDR
ncbi:MAG: Oligopeptide transport ATP-binding protein OppF [Paracidovorax wautersii]|uniref:Oligopeptide transport ATP-binding protein OppF n=1 Tax=Paracidovorax wautersii TaxID=1177982 RepID=A0A7V8FPJ2_9BURK|nr:MAG: Oligopeptide transport ATP-binding protein OppF [Paracidovorax wautersii]